MITLTGFVAAVVFTTGRIMTMSDVYPTKAACENSEIYKILTSASSKTESKNKIICTNKVDIA